MASDTSRPDEVQADRSETSGQSVQIKQQEWIEEHLIQLIGSLRYYFIGCGAWSDADDLVQETLVRFIKNIDRFDVRRPLKPYLLTIARNVWCNHLRSIRNKSEVELTDENVQHLAGRQDQRRESLNMTESQLTLDWIRDSVGLTPFQYNIMKLTMEGYANEEIARMLQCDGDTQRVRRELARARDKIRKCLKRSDITG